MSSWASHSLLSSLAWYALLSPMLQCWGILMMLFALCTLINGLACRTVRTVHGFPTSLCLVRSCQQVFAHTLFSCRGLSILQFSLLCHKVWFVSVLLICFLFYCSIGMLACFSGRRRLGRFFDGARSHTCVLRLCGEFVCTLFAFFRWAHNFWYLLSWSQICLLNSIAVFETVKWDACWVLFRCSVPSSRHEACMHVWHLVQYKKILCVRLCMKAFGLCFFKLRRLIIANVFATYSFEAQDDSLWQTQRWLMSPFLTRSRAHPFGIH